MTKVVVSNSGKAKVGVRYVGNTETIVQEAIDYLIDNGGGTCFIEAGEYAISTPIRLGNNIEIYGEGSHTFLRNDILPNGEDDAVLMYDAQYMNNGFTDSKMYIHDLFIGNKSQNLTCAGGIFIIGRNEFTDTYTGDYIKIENCIFENNALFPIIVLNSQNIKIKNNYIFHNCGNENGHGVSIGIAECANVDICNNHIASNRASGISVNNSALVNLSENIVKYNTWSAIFLYQVKTSNVTANIIQNNNGNGIGLDSGENVNVSNNITYNNSFNGIEVTSLFQSVINSNIMENNNEDGLHISSMGDSTISGNTSVNNGGRGMYVVQSRYNNYVGNTVFYNYSGGIIFASSTYDNNNYNTVNGNLTDNLTSQGDNSNFEHNLIIINQTEGGGEV